MIRRTYKRDPAPLTNDIFKNNNDLKELRNVNAQKALLSVLAERDVLGATGRAPIKE